MNRTTRAAAALVALATIASGLVLALGAAPAQARWSDVGGITHSAICKQAPAAGRGWVFLTRASKRAGLEDARVGVALRADGQRRDGWRSGWLGDRGVERGRLRSHRGAVRIIVWQEGGDRDSNIGTAASSRRLDAAQVRLCG